MKKTKISFAYILCLAVGAVTGWKIGAMLKKDAGFVGLLTVLLSLILAIFLQLIIHEAGHLVFGLLSGYRFESFRILNLMLKKEHDGCHLRKFSLAGTAGQCIMSPPDLVDGKMPYVLYNLGGSLANAISFVVFGSIYLCVDSGTLVSSFVFFMTIISAVIALTNGIPMQTGEINNDGYNALSLGKDPKAIRALWLQLKVNSEISNKKLCDLPDEWFELPDDEEMKNAMIAAVGVFCCDRMMSQHRFEQAEETIRHYLDIDNGIVGVHEGILICDEIFCMILRKADKTEIEPKIDKKQKSFMKAMANYPTVIRTRYAYAVYVLNDLAEAQKMKNLFEKVKKNYPYPTEIATEEELMEIFDRQL